jgi:hypothetical protein
MVRVLVSGRPRMGGNTSGTGVRPRPLVGPWLEGPLASTVPVTALDPAPENPDRFVVPFGKPPGYTGAPMISKVVQGERGRTAAAAASQVANESIRC